MNSIQLGSKPAKSGSRSDELAQTTVENTTYNKSGGTPSLATTPLSALQFGRGKGRGDAEDLDVGVVEGADSQEEADETLLDKAEAKVFRGVAARLNYMGPDRPDMQYAIKEVARCMANPRVCD